MHTAFSAFAQPQQQQRQQMQATSEIAQRSPEPLAILSFGKAQRKELRVASACDEELSERYQRGRDSEDPFDAPPHTHRMRG